MITFPHGTPVYLTDEIRRIETLAAAGPNPPQLMERAGRAAAELARELAGGNGKPVAVIAGPLSAVMNTASPTGSMRPE